MIEFFCQREVATFVTGRLFNPFNILKLPSIKLICRGTHLDQPGANEISFK